MGCCDTPKLTIGMAVYDDFGNSALTINALRLKERLPSAEIIIVDNNPNGRQSIRYKGLCERGGGGLRYVPLAEPVGTSAPRDEIFRQAKGEIVCVIDPHIMIADEGLKQLIEFADANPTSLDLWQGPMLWDDLTIQGSSTHFAPVWGEDLMFGKWAHDPRATGRDSEPFEIPLMGLGLFACRKSAWLGMPGGLRGFGGEEGFLHEQFRQAGRRTLCLPFLAWWHLFRDDATPYPGPTLDDRCRNYLIWSLTLSLPLDEIRFQYVEGPNARLSPQRFDSLLDEAQKATAEKRPLPPIMEQVWNFATAAAGWLARGFPVVTEEGHTGRTDVCHLCPFRADKVCTKCACYIDAKAVIETQHCPKWKWPGDTERIATETELAILAQEWQPGDPHPANFDPAKITEYLPPPTAIIPPPPVVVPTCGHHQFAANVNVQKYQNGTKTQAEITIRCSMCGKQFIWPDRGGSDIARFDIQPPGE